MIEAMKQWLEALEHIDNDDKNRNFLSSHQYLMLDKTIKSLRQAIAEAEKQEPVPCVVLREGLPTLLSDKAILPTDQRLYTHPQPKAEKQEPIAMVTGVYGGRFIVEPLNPAMVLPTNMALYAEPQPKQEPVAIDNQDLTIAYMSGFYDGKKKREWVGLTKKQFQETVHGLEDLEDCWIAIEAKLKEKNNA